MWGNRIKAYRARDEVQEFPRWEDESKPAIKAVDGAISRSGYFSELILLWSQETDQRAGSALDLEVRKDNVNFMKVLGM